MVVGVQGDTLFSEYRPDGTLLQRTYKRDDSTYWKRDYIQGKEFFNDTLNVVYHSNGRALKVGDEWNLEYWISDHLGNVRVSFEDKSGDGIISNSEILSRHDYYSFGMEHNLAFPDQSNEQNVLRHLYNEQEFLKTLGLDLFDYGARLYDPSIARWTSIDALSELDHNLALSPYGYAANNPILNIDINGLDWFRNKETGEEYWEDRTEAKEGEEHLGRFHIVEGKYGFVLHDQNEVIGTVSKAEGGDIEIAQTQMLAYRTSEQIIGPFNPDGTEAMLATGELIQEAILIYAPVPKATKPMAQLQYSGIKTVDDLILRSAKGPRTKGSSTLFIRGGGYKQAVQDFYSLGPKNVKTISTPKGELITGKLSNGHTITARSFSSQGRHHGSRPTLEIRNPSNGRGKEFRY